jgi:hypothetical protein
MLTSWVRAAAAAGALSSATVPQDASQLASDSLSEARPYPGTGTERARILGIAAEVRKLVARSAVMHPRAVIAPRTLESLGVGEVARANLVTGLATRFNVDIGEADAQAWRTVGDVVGFMAARLPSAGT